MFLNKKQTAATSDHEVQQLMVSGRTKAIASSAQQRIYMHENRYYSGSDFSVYNYLIPLTMKRGSVSIELIRLSLATVIQQHTVLRTAIRFNPMNNLIEQYIQPFTNDIYSFQHSGGVSTLEQLDRLLTNESVGKYFDVENGKVLRCHVVQRFPDNHDGSLHEGDLIIFVIHYIAFDLSSYKPFLKAFERACWANEYQQSVLTIPQYIDFALYEQALLADTSAESKMNKARRFWANLMHGYDWDKIRHLVPNEDRTDRHHSGHGYSTAFTINQDVVDSMMLFDSTNNVTMFSLSLACYYTFLFKLTNHDDDLCVVSSAANRSGKELEDMIGDIFKYQDDVDLLANRFQHILTQLFSSSSIIHQPIYKLSIVLPTEQEFIHQMNNTDISTSYSWPNTVHECFVQQAQLYPQKLALELDEQSLTYSELLYSVYCLTNYLIDKIQPNEIIYQCVERSVEMIIGMLAILSSGAVYCPLSPLDPLERLKTLIEDTSAKTLLIHSFTWQTIVMTHTSCNLIITDSFIMFNHINYNNDHHITKPISVTSDNIAYIIFTSGTTGIPKAVVISHSHLLLYLQSSV
ncbi:unnamed protein product, partial [Adineta steineri]